MLKTFFSNVRTFLLLPGHPCALAILLTVFDLFMLVTLIGPALVAIMLLTKKNWSWLLTPDTPTPTGFWNGFIWLAWRNRWHGLDFKFAQPTTVVWPFTYGLFQNGKFWYWLFPILKGKYVVKMGYRQYTVNSSRYNVPCFTITVP